MRTFQFHPVTTAVLRTPELDEGALFRLRDDRWVEVASGDLPGTFERFFRRLGEARSEWREGVLRVEGPPGAEVVLLVPDPEGFPVTEDSTFLEDGPLPEGAHVLLGERVRAFRTHVPWRVRLPFEVARESLVSVRWVEGSTYYEHSDWAAHDWDRAAVSHPARPRPELRV
ncbi:hypothetical protein [Methanopyrus kandleri]|uniref:Uncharacterized protein specific for M.kandleri, MK-22 family n=2 Tax=Methanopyrus kandleri TaxID=2320 RepID=Q8TW94_METKA|nr:hypothetical protein [Methanopyrus kandleri]AAM02355.1 Uncharacterized protein specific for M.kandleri, MK-22 family [Methanopyrus kandleri AV19]HII69778.1 hypothetical protein [Methanopyrus kandleri]